MWIFRVWFWFCILVSAYIFGGLAVGGIKKTLQAIVDI